MKKGEAEAEAEKQSLDLRNRREKKTSGVKGKKGGRR